MTNLILEIGSDRIDTWKSVKVVTDMEVLSRSFNLSIYDKKGTFTDNISAGKAASVHTLDPIFNFEHTILSGFIVDKERTISERANVLRVSGNDRLVDLVECSAIVKSQTWFKARLTKIIKDILKPFNISLEASSVSLSNDPIIERFTIPSGENAFDAIEKLCRVYAILPMSNELGDLVLGYAANPLQRTSVNLEYGVNIKAISERISLGDRFSEYTYLGQQSGFGKKWNKQMLQSSGRSFDIGVERYRPKIFISENRSGSGELEKRASWEAQVRSGRSEKYIVTVKGWYQTSNGIPIRPWVYNERVILKCDKFGIDKERLITRVEYILDDSVGEICVLTLKHPDIFKKDPGTKVDLT